MIYAKMEHHEELVCATDFKRGHNYFCPGCKERVTYKNGPQKQAHFAHYKKTCHYFSEGETDAHVIGKKLIKLWAEKRHKQAKIEEYLPEIKQRPDVLINLRNSQLVVEYQCSPLSLDSFRKRTKGYKEHGYRIFWILGKRHMLGQRLTQQQAMFINFHKNIGYFLVYLDAEKQCIVLKYELCFENLYGLRYRTGIFTDATALMLFIKINSRNRNLALTRSELAGQLTKLEKNCHYLNRYLKNQIDYCYARRQLFMGFPLCCLSESRLPPIYQHEDIFWRIRVVLELQEVMADSITRSEIELMFMKHQKITKMFFELPFVNQLARKQVNDACVKSLIKNQIIMPIDTTGNYEICRKIEWANDATLKKEKLCRSCAFSE